MDLEVLSEGVIAGEGFREGDEIRPWTELLTDERLKKGIELPDELKQLKDFLDTFDSYATSKNSAVLPVKADEALLNAVWKRLAGALRAFTRQDKDEILVEPIFILALKSLIELKTETLN
ncbi:MAG: hypothetical protein L0229_24630 [Blastocatellia bacterium]|nr:hypothetical protein [Blastocatellia bacterium]